MPQARPRLLARLAVCTAALAVSVAIAGAWFAVRLERRADRVDARIDAALTAVGALERQTARSDTRLLWVGRKLQAVSHPLHATLSWPVPGPLLSGFGPRGSGMHEGIDIDGPQGSVVRPATLGIVTEAGWDNGYGNRVVVAHGRGLETVYAHLELITVDFGQLVTQATQLGTVGCTGRCDDAHLHFEIRLNGAPTDPLMWLPSRDSRLLTAVRSAG